MMIPPATAGSWSDWNHVLPVMGRPVDLAPGSHKSSVSTAAVSSHKSMPQASTPESGDKLMNRNVPQEFFRCGLGNSSKMLIICLCDVLLLS